MTQNRDFFFSKFKVNKPKLFCIGLNKTGTTSLGSFFELQGYKVASQAAGEQLLLAYRNRDFNEIAKYVAQSKAQVFQDIPFSLPFSFIYLDQIFKESKFVLTVRDSPDQWFDSILQFHRNFFNRGRPLTVDILKSAAYVYEGWAWESLNEYIFADTDDLMDKLYDRDLFVKSYKQHVLNVKSYFKHRMDKLIIINLSCDEDFIRLCNFLEIKTDLKKFPHIDSTMIAEGKYNLNFLKE